MNITDLSCYAKGAKLIEVIKKLKAQGAEIVYKYRDAGRLKVYSIGKKELIVNGPGEIVGAIKISVESTNGG